LAQAFAEHGHDLVLVARSSESLNRLATELKEKHGAHAFVITCDLSDPVSAENLHADVLKRGIQIDALVNNAGFNFYGPFAEIELATDMDIIQVNLASLVVLTKLFLRDMVSRKAGRILNVGSTASFRPAPYVSLNAATKAGLPDLLYQ
jgi:short-subunit dehydrogenase